MDAGTFPSDFLAEYGGLVPLSLGAPAVRIATAHLYGCQETSDKCPHLGQLPHLGVPPGSQRVQGFQLHVFTSQLMV